MQSLRLLWGSILTMLLCATLSLAQTGSIQGTVTDSAGAVVSGAEITVRNLGSNAVRTVTSGGTGAYSVSNLAVGHYEVTVKMASFKTFHASDLVLTVAETLSVNVQLEPGAVTEEVQVRADQIPDIDLETSQVSNLVDQAKMQNLPLVTRDPYELVLLSPGTVQTNSRLGGVSVNGSRERNNDFLLDGVDNNDTSVPGGLGGIASLNPDATEEFRVITNNFMPEYGRNNGAIVDIVTKSGTNELHGSAYWFGRYNALGARDYFNHLNDDGSVQPMNPYVRNDFGFSVGGPIVKNKTFFFVNNEWHRFRTTLTNDTIVPTAAFKTGVFTYNGFNVDISNPASQNNPLGLTLDPTLASILALYPNPNGPAVDDVRGQYFFPSTSSYNDWNLTTKIDHHITDRELLSARYAYDSGSDPNGSHSDFLPGVGTVGFKFQSQNLGATLTSTLKPTLVNEAKFGFNRNDVPFNCGGLDVLNSVGALDRFGRGRDYLLPGSIGGFGCIALVDADGQGRLTGTWTLADNLSWVKGAHTMKMGADFRIIFDNGSDNFFSRDQLTFSGFTNFGQPFIDIDPTTPCDPNTGAGCDGPSTLQDMSSMLFGIADTESQAQFFDKSGTRKATDFRQFRQHEYGFYFQDSWKVRQNLTVNLGARYQFNGVPYEVNGNLSNLYVPANGPAPLTFQLAGPGSGRLLYNNDFSNFEPRVGFSWDPFNHGKTSIRGAYGIFHDRVFGNLFGNAKGSPPFQATYSNIAFDVPGNLPLPADQPTSPTVQDGASISPTLFDPHLRMPYSQNWNFGVQHSLYGVTLEVNYVGTRGVHLIRAVDGNPPDPQRVQQLIAMGVDPTELQFAALYVGAEFFGLPFDAAHNSAFASNFSGGGAALNRSIGNSTYNGLQVNLTKRFARGFQIQGGYTYSHTIDDAPDPIDPAENNRVFPRNSYAIGNERGNSDYDLRHRLVANYVWELPFGKGKAFANAGLVGKVLEGWQLSGVTSVQSGHPYDIFYGGIDSEHTGLTSRANLNGDPSLPSGHPKTQTGPPASAFGPPDVINGLPGTVGRNHFNGPGYYNWDASVSKNTSLGERFKLETRFEFYNVFNRVNFDQPGNLVIDPGTFGFSTATVSQSDGTTSARQLQFAMKLKF